MTVSRWAGPVVVAACCALGAVGCGAAPVQAAAASSATPTARAEGVQVPAAAVHEVASVTARAFTPCTGPVSLEASDGRRAAITLPTKPVLRVRVGDVIRIVATGRCGREVTAGVRAGVLRSSGGDRLIAARAGTAVVLLTYPMCANEALQSACQGGVDLAGGATVVVTPA